MKVHLSQRVLKHLATLSMAVACGVVPGASLLRIPAEVVTALMEEVENDLDFSSDDRKRVLGLLSDDPRVLVRKRVAEASLALWPKASDAAQQLLKKLVNDPSRQVRAAAARALSTGLSLSPPIERVELVCKWTVSEGSEERAAVAKALSSATPLLVTDMAVEQLASDADAHVRRGAIRAAAFHFDENPELYRQIALSLVSDTNREVRRVARRLLARPVSPSPAPESEA